MPRDYYEVLGVSKTAADAEIKKAYKELSRKYHPDRNAGDKDAEAKFKEVQEAYEVLSDKEKRAQFDRFGFVGPGAHPFGQGDPGRSGFEGTDPADLASMFAGFTGMGGIPPEMADLFGVPPQTTGRPRRGRRGRPARPIELDANIPFESAALGGKLSLRVGDATVEVTIPAGIDEGQKRRVPGQGPGGTDILITFHIEPHPYYRREGKDLILKLPLTITEAALGTKVEVPTLAGSRGTIKVPAGTSTGQRIRVKGQGIAGGHLFLEVEIVAPAHLDAKSRELLEEFARRNPQNPRSGEPWDETP